MRRGFAMNTTLKTLVGGDGEADCEVWVEGLMELRFVAECKIFFRPLSGKARILSLGFLPSCFCEQQKQNINGTFGV